MNAENNSAQLHFTVLKSHTHFCKEGIGGELGLTRLLELALILSYPDYKCTLSI